ncbi:MULTISPECIES: restriction endonuclease subunit S [Acinetobacter calcoaceticus/baumannii complex]|uniref:restriction endonuclease subunit S n=1 Tax=Acinetobacter calcoaceticus/baumannii complex TaxID=909768 RepID=UPI001EEE80B3|nr:restriction endonuclease subunit S [Acinetobacter baumannii]UJX50551.1 restriction endonuclease subunit S [Acinetobacter baumannii]
MAKYQTYAEYKDSGVEWLGEIPSHWDYFDGKRIFSSVRKQALSSDEQLAASQKYGVIPQNLMMQLNDSKVMLALKGTESFRHVEKNNFVISLRSFEGGIEHSNYEGCVSPAYTVLSSKKNIDYRYFKYLFKSAPFIAALQSTTDSLRDGKSISYEQFGNITLPLFSKVEQNTIANFLDHETAKIDSLIAKQEKLIELLKEKRQAVISHAVTKGLDPNVPMKDSGVEWLGEVPEHWIVKSYRLASRIYRGKFGHRPRNDPAFYDGDYPFIQTGDVARAGKYITSYSQTLNEKGKEVSQLFPKGTLMMAIAANIGDIAILGFEAYAPDSVVGFKPNNHIDLEFLRYSFIAALPALEQTSTQSTQANLNVERIGAVKGTFPSLQEQREIVGYLDNLLEQYRNLVKIAENAIFLMQERRTALISAAVTGKIDVRNWQAPSVTEADTELSA